MDIFQRTTRTWKNSMQIEIEGSNEKKKRSEKRKNKKKRERMERGWRGNWFETTTSRPLDAFSVRNNILTRRSCHPIQTPNIRWSSGSNNISFANKRNAFRPSRSNFSRRLSILFGESYGTRTKRLSPSGDLEQSGNEERFVSR